MIYYIFFMYLLQYSSSLIFYFYYTLLFMIIFWNIYYNTITAWRSVSIKSNTRYKSLLFSAFIIFNNLTIFSWPFNSYKNITSLNVLYASVALWKASKTFFKATIFFFLFWKILVVIYLFENITPILIFYQRPSIQYRMLPYLAFVLSRIFSKYAVQSPLP